MASPLLQIGTFGTHVVCCSGIFSFSGDIPCGIKQGGYTSEQGAINAFVQWFKEQDVEWQRAHVADLRNDVFVSLLNSMTSSPFMTIAEYWQMHGYGKAEAKAMEREQIARAVAKETMYDAMEGDEYDYL